MKTLILVFLMTASLAQAVPRKDCQRTFKVYVNPIAPVSYRDIDGKLRGVGRDVGHELEKRTGCHFSVEETSTFEVWRALEKDRVDITMVNIENSTPAASYGRFILFYVLPRAFVARKEDLRRGVRWSDLLENKKLKFVTLTGVNFFYLPEEIAMLRKQKRLVEVIGIEEAISFVTSKRADVLISSPGAMQLYMNRMGVGDRLSWVIDDKNTRNAGMYISKRRVNDDEYKMIKSAIDELREEGWLAANLEKYRHEQYPPLEQKKVPAKNHQ